MTTYDTFPYAGEADILECRLRELEDLDIHHVIVEAAVTHRGDPKPFTFIEDEARFKPWWGRITYVRVAASALPSVEENPDPWSREWAQREFCHRGLEEVPGAKPDDYVLHGDADEIPAPGALKALEMKDLPWPAVFEMRLCQYAADWVHPEPWHGTIRTRWRSAGSFAQLRTLRNQLPTIMAGGSHLSWMGGTEAHIRKLGLHCHLEMTQATETALRSGEWLRTGQHSDGRKLIPVDVDETWPRWVYERKCPESWFRPREDEAVA